MVQIEQHVWGMTPEGEAIILYTVSYTHLTLPTKA